MSNVTYVTEWMNKQTKPYSELTVTQSWPLKMTDLKLNNTT